MLLVAGLGVAIWNLATFSYTCSGSCPQSLDVITSVVGLAMLVTGCLLIFAWRTAGRKTLGYRYRIASSTDLYLRQEREPAEGHDEPPPPTEHGQ